MSIPAVVARPAVLTVPEVQAIIGRSLATIYEWINAGVIPSFKVGRRVYIKRAELDRWLDGDGQPLQSSAGGDG